MSLTKVVIVQERPNPSTDFFVRPQFPLDKYKVSFCVFDELANAAELDNSIVVIVRYLSLKWKKHLEKHLSIIQRLVFFMDDDILDHKSLQGLPLRYRLKIFRLAISQKKWLQKHVHCFWTSSLYLVEKYSYLKMQQVIPKPVSPVPVKRVFYHGSASHQLEFVWLKPVIERVLSIRDDVVFEIIGGQEINLMFRRLGRVNVVHPMDWISYQSFICFPGRDIGLAPSIDCSFNRSRSYTKFFDITTANAVGVYALHSACGEYVNHGEDGVCLEMNQDLWVETIIDLLDEPEKRSLLKENAKKRLLAAAKV